MTNRALAELKGLVRPIPNQGIVIGALALREAEARSEIENIDTARDELFQSALFSERPGCLSSQRHCTLP
jgi:hypothetical protein